MWIIAPFFKTALARQLATILDYLTPVLGRTAAKDPQTQALFLPVWKRIRDMAGRLDSLILRWKAGKRLTPRPRKPAIRQPRPQAAPASAPPRFPTRRCWLFHIAQPTAQFTGAVQALLAEPELAALLQAAPQAGRILRPLCHAFGIDPPEILRLPPRPPRQRPPRERPAKPKPAPVRQAYPFPGVPKRWQTRIPGINAPKRKKPQN